MTIKQLITKLEEQLKETGDVPVILAADSEGNEYGTTNLKHTLCPIMDNDDRVIGLALFPWEEHIMDADEACFRDRSATLQNILEE